MAIYLRIGGIGLSALGALLLAWRVKGILDVITLAHEANDLNTRIIMDMLNGQPQTAAITVGMNQQVIRKQKRGVWLLVAGFLFIGIGNALVGYSWYLEGD